MNMQRILLIAKRYLFGRFLKFEELIDFSFWPTLDIIVWGGVGLALAKNGQASTNVTLSILSVVIVRVYTYSYLNNAFNFSSEMMSKNIINLFAAPLNFNEWFCGAMISGGITSFLLLHFSAVIAWLIFGVFILKNWIGLLVFIFPLLIAAWAVSSITIMILMLLGVHAQRLIFVMAWLFIPFSGVYYSLDLMPPWIQTIACYIPMSYIFQALRIFVLEGRFSFQHLSWGYGLAIIYFIITLTACNLMFERSRRLGLASLERA